MKTKSSKRKRYKICQEATVARTAWSWRFTLLWVLHSLHDSSYFLETIFENKKTHHFAMVFFFFFWWNSIRELENIFWCFSRIGMFSRNKSRKRVWIIRTFAVFYANRKQKRYQTGYLLPRTEWSSTIKLSSCCENVPLFKSGLK